MKKYIFLVFVLFCLGAEAQQLVRGYSAGFAYGFLLENDSLNIVYEDVDFKARTGKSNSNTYMVGFPFDYGFSRHRFVLTPGIDITIADYSLNVNGLFPNIGNDTDLTKVRTTLLMPHLGLNYKCHFYFLGIQLAVSAGAFVKIPISYDYGLIDKNKTDLHEFSNLSFYEGSVLKNLENLDIQYVPNIGLDIYLSRFLVFNLFAYFSPLSSIPDAENIRGFYGTGVSYLVPFGKEDKTRVLQYYKNK